MYTIYGLEDQRFTGVQAIFYVGITEDVYIRFSQHLRCDDGNIDKSERIEDIKQSGVMLIMRTIEVVETFEEAKDREQYWIHHYLSWGIRLCNVDIAQSFTYEDFLVKMGKSLPDTETSRTQRHIRVSRSRQIKSTTLIGLTYQESIKLLICQKKQIKVADLRSAVKRGDLKEKSDGSLARSAVENWAKNFSRDEKVS